jgi:hypothetical protein
VGQRGDYDDEKIVHRWCCKSLNVHTNNTNGSDYAKGFFPEMFSWIRIRVQKGIMIKKTHYKRRPNTVEEEDRKYPWPDPDLTKKKFSIESGYIKPRRFTGIHEVLDLEY